jgi:hypothetical protein
MQQTGKNGNVHEDGYFFMKRSREIISACEASKLVHEACP